MILATHGFIDGHHWLSNGLSHVYGARPLFAMPCICQLEYEKQTSYIWIRIHGWRFLFLVNTLEIVVVETTTVMLWNDISYDFTNNCLPVSAWQCQPSEQLDKVSEGRMPEHLLNTPRILPNLQLRPIWSSDNDCTGFRPPGSLHTLGADGHI